MKLFREIGAGVGILAAVLLIGLEWSRLPAAMATHFGWGGAVNGYGSRMMLWAIVALMVFIYALLSMAGKYPCRFNLPIPRDNPRRGECELIAAEMVGWLKLEVVWLFVYMIWAIIRLALNDGPGVRGWFIPVTVVVVGGTLMFYIAKMRRLLEA